MNEFKFKPLTDDNLDSIRKRGSKGMLLLSDQLNLLNETTRLREELRQANVKIDLLKQPRAQEDSDTIIETAMECVERDGKMSVVVQRVEIDYDQNEVYKTDPRTRERYFVRNGVRYFI